MPKQLIIKKTIDNITYYVNPTNKGWKFTCAFCNRLEVDADFLVDLELNGFSRDYFTGKNLCAVCYQPWLSGLLKAVEDNLMPHRPNLSAKSFTYKFAEPELPKDKAAKFKNGIMLHKSSNHKNFISDEELRVEFYKTHLDDAEFDAYKLLDDHYEFCDTCEGFYEPEAD